MHRMHVALWSMGPSVWVAVYAITKCVLIFVHCLALLDAMKTTTLSKRVFIA